MPSVVASYLRVIGRGKHGSRALSREQAHDLMTRLLSGQLSDLEKGGFALAMRIKGESPAELAGFMDALHGLPSRFATDCAVIASTGLSGPAVVLPSYNGARKLPNLTPLLAYLLARQGVPVLVHGVEEDPGRTTSAAIFAAMGNSAVTSPGEIADRWERQQPAFVSLSTLHPALADLLALRAELGLRNPGHTMAKLMLPWSGALRVVNHTHPEYADSLSQFLDLTRADALLMRGTEGEPVADVRRLPELKCFVDGQLDPALSVQAQSGSRAKFDAPAGGIDAGPTAEFTESILSGDLTVPEPISRQVECLLALREAMPATCEPALL